MPENFKEEIYFTALMAGLMVLGMTIYNVVLHNGLSTASLLDGLAGYPLALLVAVVLDMLIVGPIVKKSVIGYIERKQLKDVKVQVIGLTISLFMVLGMVSFMSVFGMIMSPLQSSNLFAGYAHTWMFNVIVALPLQLLLVGPFSRTMLAIIQK